MISGGKEVPKITTGLDLIHGAIIDQHFLRRNRISRLISAVKSNPELVGYGIDEKTAIIVSNGEYKVIGNSYVLRVRMNDGEIVMDSFENGEVIKDADN
jgi:cyanophycinase